MDIFKEYETADFRMVWEALTICPGTCSGCNIFKKTNQSEGYWTTEQFLKASSITKTLLKQFNEIKNQKIFLTAGDYLRLSDKQMTDLLDIVDDTMDKNAASRIFLFTTSAIGKEAFLKERIDNLQKLLIERNLGCFPEVVFDFAKIKYKKYWDEYIKNINLIIKAFPVTAITIQVGSDTFDHQISFEKLGEFIEKCNVKRLEFVITPHTDNSKLISDSWSKTITYLEGFYDFLHEKSLTGANYKHPQLKSIHEIIKKLKNIESYQDLLISSSSGINSSSFFIKNDGQISNFYSGISNIYPHSYAEQVKYNIFTSDDLSIKKEDLIKDSLKFSYKVATKNHCFNCEFKNSCILMGNMLLVHNLKKEKNNQCPINIYNYIKKIESNTGFMDLYCESLNTIDVEYKTALMI